MCGIAGAFSTRPSGSVVRDMADRLGHRGPDDAGFSCIATSAGRPAGAFGHRRLAVLDLSAAGHQPMRSADGRFLLVYNGEIYNFRELRTELERAGTQFSSTSDTEVLLAGWALHGSAFLTRLRGMFAFAIWDGVRNRGCLVRDPFGIKPLYIAQLDGTVLFASELRALIGAAGIPRVLSRAAVRSFLGSGSVAEPLTIVDGVHALPAGTLTEIELDAGGARLHEPRTYDGSVVAAVSDIMDDADAAADMVRSALRQSAEHHLVSDVPVALFLSGGMDSAAVVGLASEVSDSRLDTFTVTFEEAEYSEAAPARALARRFGTRHHEVPVSGDALLRMLPDAFHAMDQPSFDGLNTYAVCRAVSTHGIKVVLSGLGADELFAGYPSFRRARQVSRLPAALMRAAAAGAAHVRGVRGEKLHALLGSGTPAWSSYRASRTLFGDRQVAALTGGHGAVAAPPVPAGLSLLQQVSWYELTGYMRNTLLRDSDMFSMAQGLELRVPFVDRAVALAASRVHDRLKLSPDMQKPALLRAVRDLLPAGLAARPKRGFTLPFQRWLRRELRAELEARFTAEAFERTGIDPAAGRAVWHDFLANRAGMSWSRPWSLYTLIRWAELHELSVPAVDEAASA